jgi:hypothetical protein
MIQIVFAIEIALVLIATILFQIFMPQPVWSDILDCFDDALCDGTEKDNIMIGDNISNTMRGLDGADQMIGGEGNDDMSGDGRVDYMLGDEGADTMNGAMVVIKYYEVMGMITSLVDMEQMK